MFLALGKFGMVRKFINMVRLLFDNVKAFICFTKNIIKSFMIAIRIRQGHPLTLYMFILVGKIFNFMVK
jgi:hypothetical protein